MTQAHLTPLQVLMRHSPHQPTLYSMLVSRAASVPGHVFIVFGDRTYTYKQTVCEVDRFAGGLAARGVNCGDRVAVVSGNHPSIAFTFFALARLGAIMVPLNPALTVAEAAYALSHAGVSGVVAAHAAVELATAACAEARLNPWIATADALPAEATSPMAEAGDADTTCVFIYTSGTTGFPKGVMHSQRTVVLSAQACVERMHLQPDERVYCVLPLFHINGLFYVLCGTLAAGATVILEERFSASAFWKRAADAGVTQANVMAAMTGILMRRPRDEFVPRHCLRKLYGAPFSDEVYRVFHGEFGIPLIVEGYGMSEAPAIVCTPFEGPYRIGSMGRVARHPLLQPAEFAEVTVHDDSGLEVSDGTIGEIAVKTVTMMQGYWRDPAATAAAFRDGWFMTGDLGWRDADGYLWFVARRKDMIRRRGENISGAELDRVIGAHPDVLEAAAIPVPSELGDDEILVAAVPRPGATIEAHGIADWCRAQLAIHKLPRYIVIVDELPHTATQRVAKFKLREDTGLIARAVDFGKASK